MDHPQSCQRAPLVAKQLLLILGAYEEWVMAGWLKAQWGHTTGESQEGLVQGYRQGFTKRQIAEWVKDTEIVQRRLS